MKKTFFLVAAIVMSIAASAQVFEVVSMQQLPINLNTDVKVAAMSPKGDYMLVTSGSNQGLWRYDFATKQLSVITEAEGAGFNVQVSTDGQEIVYRETKTGSDHLRRSDIVRMNMNDAKRSTIAYAQRDSKKMAISNTAMSVSIDNQKIILTRHGKEIILTPSGEEQSYIWPSISPDGSKLCYYVAGEGCYVCNIDGSNPKYIAHDCRAAQWYDNNTIVAMADEDDGYFITASAIVVYTLDGRYQELTKKDLVAMYPCVSEGMITFATANGDTYLMMVK
ncbi:MAG: hypothetical protein IJX48_05265 [Paludibacteraceae bacterium]|nr:hypothetical protein [Paludibacteraceae bacterium]